MTESNDREWDRLDGMGQFSSKQIKNKLGISDSPQPVIPPSETSSEAPPPKVFIKGLDPIGTTEDGRPIYPHLGGITQESLEAQGVLFAPHVPKIKKRRRR